MNKYVASANLFIKLRNDVPDVITFGKIAMLKPDLLRFHKRDGLISILNIQNGHKGTFINKTLYQKFAYTSRAASKNNIFAL